MALYEYHCSACGSKFDKRMPMTDVLQLVPCPKCGKQAKKTIGNFALVGRAEEGFGDGPAPWESGGDDDDGGGDDFGGHGHSHGPGGHTH